MATGTQILLDAHYPNILWGSGGIITNPSIFSLLRQNPKAMESGTPVQLTHTSHSHWRNEPCHDKGCWPRDFNHMRSCNHCPGEHGLKHPIASMKWNLITGVREKVVQFEH